jgi:hypothetical protein
MSHIEAMKQALEALDAGPNAYLLMNTGGIANNLRQAIAEAEKQEAKAWIHKQTGVITKEWSFDKDLFEPLYTYPQPKQEPLGEEFSRILHENLWDLYER